MRKNVDILIVAEGTYPYVRGGVSSWIHQLITGLSEFSFGILFLGSKKEDYQEKKYEMPKNVLFFEEYFLFDPLNIEEPKKRRIKSKYVKKLEDFYEKIKNKEEFPLEEILYKEFLNKEITINDFLYSLESWEFIKRRYEENCPDIAFLDYFWSVRSIHRPLWLLWYVASLMNMCKVVHSPSTGYAGFISSLISKFYNIPFVLTEHGIYIRERKMDLYSAPVFDKYKYALQKDIQSVDYLKEMWIRFFEKIGFLTYKSAKDILSLFQGAKELQVKFGADEKKCKVIPNGVNIKHLNSLIEKRKEEIPKVITLLGRVVSIKDIKTFIRAMRIVVDKMPEVEGWVVGPTDEDENYANECFMMVESMHLKNNVKFLGFQKPDDIFPKTGLLTLTSISEGMPLVILEGFAAGLPCVATDVGSCKELIYGALNKEDIEIGKAGEVVLVANPKELADAYIKILSDKELWRRYQKSALKRVETFYRQEQFFENYRKVYKEALAWRG